MFPGLTHLPLDEQAQRFLREPQFQGELRSYARARLVHEVWFPWIDHSYPWPNPWALSESTGYEVRIEAHEEDAPRGYVIHPRKRLIILDSLPDCRALGFLLSAALADVALGSLGNRFDRYWAAFELLASPATLFEIRSPIELAVRQANMPGEFSRWWWMRVRASSWLEEAPADEEPAPATSRSTSYLDGMRGM